MAVLLFSYGTLQKKDVQMATFGRELTGREDALPGYRRLSSAVSDPRVAAMIGETYYFSVEPSDRPEDAVSGMLFEITDQELAAADRYEGLAGYRRISVLLRSGSQAWVYLWG
ncbi:MAG: gamma-glutamylcyclotransferase [Bryobacterales bacterium]|nr:gamma-glutamylcyclotransferase [Bryobacterales bacterium]